MLPMSGQIALIADSSLAMYTMSPASAVTIERSLSLSFNAIKPPSKPKIIENGPVIRRFGYTVRRYWQSFFLSSGILSTIDRMARQ